LAADPLGVLVTGGAGYIGSHACKALNRAGYRVVVFDNLSAGHREAVRFGTLVEGDTADVAAVRAALREHRISAVLHFAAFLDVSESTREPARYYRNNVAGALGVLEAMAAESVTRFVFSSTCATYGEPIETPLRETHPQRPINAYGETKLAIERALPHFERAYGMTWAALRYFNAAGADPEGEIGEDHHPEIHLIPRAIEAATGGPPLMIFGEDYPTPDGTCLRDYIHVSDLADAHVKALERISGAVGAGVSGAYNLGTGTPQSVRDVIAAVERVSGRTVARTTAARRPGDPAILFAAADKARAELGWTPRFPDLDAIVRTAWQWSQTHPQGYRTAVRP
jgi:UDP-glucose-4-epimerase GalE